MKNILGEETNKSTEALRTTDSSLEETNFPSVYEHLQQHNIDANDDLDSIIDNTPDINQLIPKLHHYEIVKRLDTLIERNDLDVNLLVSNLDPSEIIENLQPLLEHKADVNLLVSRLEPLPFTIVNNLDILMDDYNAKINFDELIPRLGHSNIDYKFDTLIAHGVDANLLASHMKPNEIADHLDALIKNGADIDIDNLVADLHAGDILSNLDVLMQHGANIDHIIPRLDPHTIKNNRARLRRYSPNI